MPTFRLKLLVYFLLMGALPLGAATWAVTRVSGEMQRRATDERLGAELRASLAAYRRELDAASAAAARLARSSRIASRLEGAERHVLVVDRTGAVLDRRPPHVAAKGIRVVDRGRPIGTIETLVELDRPLLGRIERATGLAASEHVAIVERGRVVVADRALRGHIAAGSSPTTARLGRRDYRVVLARLPGAGSAALAVLSPAATAGAAGSAQTKGLLAALFATLFVATLIGCLEGRAIVRTIRSLVAAAEAIASGRLEPRVEVRGRDELADLGRAFNTMAGELGSRLGELEAQRVRLRQIVTGFGAALAATHDVDELLRVIVDAAVEATGAGGGTFIGREMMFLGSGDFDAEGSDRLELPVDGPSGRFGVLTLVAPRFDDESVATARSLVAHAVIALENARLHGIVAQQAMTDSLTGLANRRQGEETLHVELAHVRRFGGTLAVAIADLDDFKSLNDRHGHPVGDAILREFGEVLRANLRASDVAARWGGEEFLLVLRETDLDGACDLAERIRASLASRTILAPNGAQLAVRASFGVAAWADGDTDVVAAADKALYEAKRTGKNRVVPAAPRPAIA